MKRLDFSKNPFQPIFEKQMKSNIKYKCKVLLQAFLPFNIYFGTYLLLLDIQKLYHLFALGSLGMMGAYAAHKGFQADHKLIKCLKISKSADSFQIICYQKAIEQSLFKSL